MASTQGLVPITREFLRKFYEGFPYDPAPAKLGELVATLDGHVDAFVGNIADGAALKKSLVLEAPHKIDENLFRNREQCEELIDLLKDAKRPAFIAAAPAAEARKLVEETQKAIEDFQRNSAEKIAAMVTTYMPQDFRGTLIRQQKERSERKRQLEVEALTAQGCTIKQKYEVLWRQQMERRKTLASLGSATGVFKVLVKYLAGVPQVLLDFTRQINDHHGPMEEQRNKYGPPLYQLTQCINTIHLYTALWGKASPTEPNEALATLLKDTAAMYASEMQRYLKFLWNLFDKSPFLISAEEAMKFGPKAAAEDEFKKVVVSTSHEMRLDVEGEGSLVAWDFKIDQGMDIGFSVSFLDNSNAEQPLLPYRRCMAHQGHFFSTGTGVYVLKWDNSYSMLYKKTMHYKAAAVPPVAINADKDADKEAGADDS
eukprot:jgi/Chlat1/962/Chrsp108S01379